MVQIGETVELPIGAQPREPGWYWTRQRGIQAPMMAYCHGSSWNGLLGAIDASLIEEVLSPPITGPDEWRCFHCGEVFTDHEAAADHFGVQIDGLADEPACRLNATEGLLVKMLREAQEELRRYHEETDAATKTFYELGAKHTVALREEEEKGYARGLKDGRELPDHYESHEALDDLVALWAEHEALTGGGPGWRQRFNAALTRAQDLVRREP